MLSYYPDTPPPNGSDPTGGIMNPLRVDFADTVAMITGGVGLLAILVSPAIRKLMGRVD